MSPNAKNGVLALVAIGLGLGLSAKPWMLMRKERAEAAQQVRLAEIDEARMVRDRSEEARLQTEIGKEEVLRHQGYHRPGELPLEP